MTKVITINNWKRPDFYEKVLEGLATNPQIDNYIIFNIVDQHPNGMFTKQFKKIDQTSSLNVETVVAPAHIGCAAAKRLAFKTGFDTGASFVLNLEDDIVP